MKDFSACLVVTDLDGTLLDEQKQISQENLDAIRRFTGFGGHFTIATGRSIESARPYAAAVGGHCPVIVLNGAAIYDYATESALASHTVDPCVREIVRDVMERFPSCGVEAFLGNRMHVLRENSQIRHHITLENLAPIYCTLETLPDGWFKVLLSDEEERLEQVIAYLQRRGTPHVDCVRTTKDYYELLPQGVNKGSALKELCGLLQIEVENSAAIGDYYNDVELLEAAHVSAVTRNAPQALRARADIVTRHCNESAIAHLLTILTEVSSMDACQKKELKIMACKVRMGIIEETFRAKSGHPGGSLSIADTLTYLYSTMHVDPKNPKMPDRDRLVLSKGHTAPALYAVLAEKGYFPKEELKLLRKTGAMLQGHPDMKHIPGVDMTTGSLGQGISAAVGMAMSAKMSQDSYHVYAILGDGEIQEGQVWEAAMFAGAHHLDNLTAVVDNNNLQIDGTVEEVCSPYPIGEKFAAFGWHVIEICGHCFGEIEAAVQDALAFQGKPTVIVQKSVKGKGVSFMENKCEWHGSAPNEEQYTQAMAELQSALAELEA